MTVAARPNADKVTASGNALKMLVANQTSRLVIDSRQAGSGTKISILKEKYTAYSMKNGAIGISQMKKIKLLEYACF